MVAPNLETNLNPFYAKILLTSEVNKIMAKKDMMEMKGEMCCTSYGHCCNRWCKAFAAVVAVVLGLLLIWPKGWFMDPWHTVGLLVVLAGVKKFAHCCFKCQ